MQNARDLSNHAITKIMLSTDNITFAHQGEPFNLDTLSNLIKQQSTKKEDDDIHIVATHISKMRNKIHQKDEVNYLKNAK